MTLSKTKYLISATLLLALTAPVAASAQSAAPLSGLFACEIVSNKDAQLACFLTETAKLRAPELLPAVPAVEPQSLAVQRESLAIEKERLALETERLAVEKQRIAALKAESEKKAKLTRNRTLAIVETSTFGSNRFVRFTLENGEVWQQTEAAPIRLGRADPDMMMLKKTSFGAMTGRVNGKAPTIRLKQIK